MMRRTIAWFGSVAVGAALAGGAAAADSSNAPDLAHQPTLYTVGYAHLDTEWRWEYPWVIQVDLRRTLEDNFALFEKYPHYIFNFTGAFRYKLFKEYYPEDYAKLKGYITAGRWYPNGSSVDENDCNNPSAESIFRNVLYGNEYFRHEFGQASAEYMLPDCFGFPASLPSILAHAGLKGFSTAKLAWGGSAAAGGSNSVEKTGRGGFNGIPFNVGVWEGPDGQGVLAALNPGAYDSHLTSDLSSDRTLTNRINLDGQVSGVYADYRYYGTGDEGGAPPESDARMIEAMVTKSEVTIPRGRGRGRGQAAANQASNGPVRVGEGPVQVIASKADQMFLDILAMKPDPTAGFPRWKGDLEMVDHGVGAYSSEAYHKRWNRKKELLADAAEKASVAAQWLGGRPYPQERLTDAWMLLLAGQMHDILPGTATPLAYEYAWNDDTIVMNQFSEVLASATEAVASALDTEAKGTAIVVYNPLNIAREDVVRAAVSFPAGAPDWVRVIGPDGKEVPAQREGGKVLFLAKVPSVGYAVYDVQPAARSKVVSALKVTESSLENARYRVQLDTNGDVSSLFDKAVKKELLSAPVRLAIKTDNPPSWPAWNMDYSQQMAAPRAFVEGPAKVRITEKGPARAAVEVVRETEGSTFAQTIRLSAGEAGNRLEFANVIDWKSSNCNLKVTFPLSASNPVATYNWDVGTMQRANDEPRNYELPSHQWIDLTGKDGAYGATVLTDCKNGSDKPDDNTLRLTLIRTPGARGGYRDQATQDLGHHEIVYGLAGHAGDWRKEQTDWQGERLNQPLIAFESSKHAGKLGKTFSLLKLDNSRVRVLALKKAEESDEVIVRVVEMEGKAQKAVHLSFAASVAAAREVNGQEQPLGKATVTGGALVTDFTPYQIHTFAVKLAAAPSKAAAPRFAAVPLAYDRAVATKTGEASTNGFDGSGGNLPAEMLPGRIAYDGIEFQLAPATAGQPNAVVPHGQQIALPPGKFQRLYLLAAAAGGDQKAAFRVGDTAAELTVEDWGGFIGQWDCRIWNSRSRSGDGRFAGFSGLTPGFIKRAPLAWYCTHHHTPEGGNDAYAYSYLFAYAVEMPANAKTLTLPDNPNIRILAATVADESSRVHPAQPLYDTLKNLDGDGGSED
ncbi:MAG: glycoside hydrolase family 38 C-terminal domain-containing protein [Verrucomicrobiota bacterium]|jgi:alpha-mannosidase